METGSNPILLERHIGPTDVSFNTFDRGVYQWSRCAAGEREPSSPSCTGGGGALMRQIESRSGCAAARATPLVLLAALAAACGGAVTPGVAANAAAALAGTLPAGLAGLGIWG